MKSINMKLVMSALAIAMLATPALAKTHRQARDLQDSAGTTTVQPEQFQYPNGATKTGSAESEESGADFNLMRVPD
jgi:uncharacterized protein YdeI (BOF family)